MRTQETVISSWPLISVVVILLALVALPGQLHSQNCPTTPPGITCQGWNGVYFSSSPTGFGPTTAFVDVSAYATDSRCAGSSCDICDATYYALQDLPTASNNGVVIDARGFSTPQTCVSGGSTNHPNPWSASAGYSTVVLLPPGPIYITASWILPEYTDLVGEGSSLTSSPLPTTLVACTVALCGSGQAFANSDMIDMGSSAICPGSPVDCHGVIIEHLALNGSNVSGLNGIVNMAAQELSRVDDVVLTNMGASSVLGTGTGLYVNGLTSNSGPYTNIYYSGSGICADFDNSTMNGPHDSRGIHGLTCMMSSGDSSPAVYVDSANNTLDDVYISGNSDEDGILIGANYIARNTVLFNIYGSGLDRVVHISKNANSTDITAMGITSSGSTDSMYDELTTPATALSDAHVGMYIVGEPLFTGSVSRFTTSLNVPTWLVGSSNPGTGNCATGSLYSETSGLSGTLWGCQGPSGGGSTGTWQDIN